MRPEGSTRSGSGCGMNVKCATTQKSKEITRTSAYERPKVEEQALENCSSRLFYSFPLASEGLYTVDRANETARPDPGFIALVLPKKIGACSKSKTLSPRNGLDFHRRTLLSGSLGPRRIRISETLASQIFCSSSEVRNPVRSKIDYESY
jgi:hypothetical protein